MLHKTLTLFARKISLHFPPLLAITIFAFAGFFLSFSSASAFVVGINQNSFAGSFNAAGQAATKESGAHSIRVGYMHGDHDADVNWASSNGVGVLFFLGYGKGCNATTPAGRDCYAKRSAGLAQKYGNKVQYYEVWNEWNGGLGLGGGWPACFPTCKDAVMYADLLCRTYKAIKAVRPSAIVVGAVTAGTHTDFIRRMLDAGAGNCMDMISVHPYAYHIAASEFPVSSGNAPASEGADRFYQAITATHNLVKQKTGKNMKVLVTEEGRQSGSSPASEQLTADYFTEIIKRRSTAPFYEGIWWFALKDDATGAYGLLRSNNTKKPAFFAFQAAAKGTPNTGPSPTGPPLPPPPPPGPHVTLTVTPACFANADLNTFALANNTAANSPPLASLSTFELLKKNLASALFFWE